MRYPYYPPPPPFPQFMPAEGAAARAAATSAAAGTGHLWHSYRDDRDNGFEVFHETVLLYYFHLHMRAVLYMAVHTPDLRELLKHAKPNL